MSDTVGPSAEEKALFDALEYGVLAGTASELMVSVGSDQVRPIRFSLADARPFHVLETSRSGSGTPWVLTRHRLYVVQAGRALAFDIPHELLNAATDLDAIVRGAFSFESNNATYFFLNGTSNCWVYKLEQCDLTFVAQLDGHLFAAARDSQVYAVGERVGRNGDVVIAEPLLWNINSGQPFEAEGLDHSLHTFATRTAAGQFPAGYAVPRLHVDAFLACVNGAGGGVSVVAGVAEATLPQDLDAGLSSGRGHIPGVTDYVGLAYFDLVGDVLSLRKVDFGNLFVETAEDWSGSYLYVVRNGKEATKTLGSLRRLALQTPDAGEERLNFQGVDETTRFNKFRVSYHRDHGYLGLANVEWGFQGGAFAPEDYLFTSRDGLSWLFAGSSRSLAPISVGRAAGH